MWELAGPSKQHHIDRMMMIWHRVTNQIWLHMTPQRPIRMWQVFPALTLNVRTISSCCMSPLNEGGFIYSLESVGAFFQLHSTADHQWRSMGSQRMGQGCAHCSGGWMWAAQPRQWHFQGPP